MASMCVEVKTTRAISAQILRHRSFSFQEFSQRYAEVDTEAIQPVDIRLAGTTNRQSSIVGELTNEQADAVAVANHLREEAFFAYKDMVKLGIAPECARMYLPLSTSTTIYMTGTIRSFIHYVMLRCKPDTQQEHRDVAVAINNLLWDNLPNVMQAVEEHWV
jgi:thymidylate synthase (FAD)